MSKKSVSHRRSHRPSHGEFKRELVRLVTDEKYAFQAAATRARPARTATVFTPGHRCCVISQDHRGA